MSDFLNKILMIKSSKPYIDYGNYHRGNIFGITKMSRRELMHSNFIAWALDPSSSHALGLFPLYQLVRSIGSVQGNADNASATKISPALLYKFYDDNFIVDATIEREAPVPVGKNTRYIDLLIEITTSEKILPIIIENKVDANETDDQTLAYHHWSETEAYPDRSIYFDPIYIYLYPEYKSKKQKSDKYIRMTYQELVDYILDPSLAKCNDIVAINNYKQYLQALSFQLDNEKGGQTMAISSEEKQILKEFVNENRDLLCAVLGELDGVDPAALAKVTSSLKDDSKYEFEKKEYGKGQLVLAVVKQYMLDNPAATYADLQATFPKNLQGSKGVLSLSTLVKDADKGIGGKKRYFTRANEIIILASGEQVLVCREWGITNIDKFIQHVTNNLPYSVNKI